MSRVFHEDTPFDGADVYAIILRSPEAQAIVESDEADIDALAGVVLPELGVPIASQAEFTDALIAGAMMWLENKEGL